MPTAAPDAITPAQASERLDRLGFLLADFYPHEAREAHLLVVLHDDPRCSISTSSGSASGRQAGTGVDIHLS